MNVLWVLILAITISIGVGSVAQAKALDKHSKIALQQTLGLLNSPVARHNAVKSDANAAKADASVRSLSKDPKDTQEMYEISALIMEDITKSTGGDVTKLLELMAKAQQSPEAFFNSLSPKVQKRIKVLGQKIEAQQSKAPASK